MRKIILLFFCLFFISCQEKKPKVISIALDKNWYSIATNGQLTHLNGFINDVLLEISKKEKIEFTLTYANYNSLYQGLQQRQYQAIFSAIDMYNFNMAKYDFSKDLIKTGYALIISKNAQYKSLDDMAQTHIGYISTEDSLLILQKYTDIFDQAYISIPKMLSDITKLKLEGAIVSIIPGYKYIVDLYSKELKLVYPLLNEQAIRLITLKDENEEILKIFNSALEKLKKENTYKNLKIKWGLPF